MQLFPLQLVASLLAAVIAMIAIGLFLRAHVPGEVVAFTLSAYGLVRFGLELARGDVARPYLLGLSEAQWIAVATTWGCVGLDAQLGLTLGPLYLISACAVSGGAVWLVAAHFHANNAIALSSAKHVAELAAVVDLLREGGAHGEAQTTRGVLVTLHRADHVREYSLSWKHGALSPRVVRCLKRYLSLWP